MISFHPWSIILRRWWLVLRGHLIIICEEIKVRNHILDIMWFRVGAEGRGDLFFSIVILLARARPRAVLMRAANFRFSLRKGS